jgi:hypothetical protein
LIGNRVHCSPEGECRPAQITSPSEGAALIQIVRYVLSDLYSCFARPDARRCHGVLDGLIGMLSVLVDVLADTLKQVNLRWLNVTLERSFD